MCRCAAHGIDNRCRDGRYADRFRRPNWLDGIFHDQFFRVAGKFVTDAW